MICLAVLSFLYDPEPFFVFKNVIYWRCAPNFDSVFNISTDRYKANYCKILSNEKTSKGNTHVQKSYVYWIDFIASSLNEFVVFSKKMCHIRRTKPDRQANHCGQNIFLRQRHYFLSKMSFTLLEVRIAHSLWLRPTSQCGYCAEQISCKRNICDCCKRNLPLE